MTTLSNSPAGLSDDAIWSNLKRAIASSSGFKRWQQEKGGICDRQDWTLDQLVSSYLRETLETLAY
ncbi:MAG: hypothetical protein EA367_03615 [Leptolyngbya sp. DLM2.Bin15]|nr:MAG: hypothetical protein EA367_03615 [Leptolyngbya sp. DLM2.Bin15]